MNGGLQVLRCAEVLEKFVPRWGAFEDLLENRD